MSNRSSSKSPPAMKLVLAGNIQFLEYLETRYGKHATIDYIIRKERGHLK